MAAAAALWAVLVAVVMRHGEVVLAEIGLDTSSARAQLTEDADVAAVFRPAGEPLRQPRSRERVEDGQAIGLEPGVLALPEGRRAGQREQMGDEV